MIITHYNACYVINHITVHAVLTMLINHITVHTVLTMLINHITVHTALTMLINHITVHTVLTMYNLVVWWILLKIFKLNHCQCPFKLNVISNLQLYSFPNHQTLCLLAKCTSPMVCICHHDNDTSPWLPISYTV